MSTKLANQNKTEGFEYNSSNPFIASIVEHIEDSRHRKVIGHSFQDVVDKPTGNLTKQKILVLGEQKIVDKQEYSKLYMGEIGRFFGLSKKALLLLDYIMTNIKYGEDKICLYYPDVQDRLKLIRSTMYSCISQMIKAQIIAKASTNGCYYINPAVVFKGERIALVKQFICDNIPSQYDLEHMVEDTPGHELHDYINEQGEVETR